MEVQCIQTVITEILQNKAPTLAKANWSWGSECDTAKNAKQWKNLCDSVFIGPPNWEKYARIFATILCISEQKIPLWSVEAIATLDSAFITFFSHVNYYFPTEHRDYNFIAAAAKFLRSDVTNRLFSVWEMVK
jgi:hypothetical protein